MTVRKYASDEPTALFLDGKAYDLTASPLMSPMGALEVRGRIFLLRDEGEPFRTPRTIALRNEKDLQTIGVFVVADEFRAGVYAESRRVQQLEGWVLALDVQNPLRHGDGVRSARLRIFPDGRVLSLPNGRDLRELKIPTGEVSDLLRWLADDQKVPAVNPQAVLPGDLNPTLAQKIDTFVGSATFLQFKHDGQLHSMTVGSELSSKDGIFTFAGIQKPDGTLVPVSVRVRTKLQTE
jgi:hypothetical protein